MQICKLLNTDIHLGELLTKCSDLGIGVFGTTVCFAFDLVGRRHYGATSSNCICGVLLGGSGVKMGGIHTAGPVAMVKTIKSVGDGSVMEFVRKAVRFNVAAVDSDLPVSMIVAAPSPVPAVAKATLVDLCPKSFIRWTYCSNLVVMAANKANGLTFNVSESRIAASRNRGRLTTAAFTEFYSGFVRGIIAHVASPFSTIGHSAGLFQQSLRFFVFLTTSLLYHTFRSW